MTAVNLEVWALTIFSFPLHGSGQSHAYGFARWCSPESPQTINRTFIKTIICISSRQKRSDYNKKQNDIFKVLQNVAFFGKLPIRIKFRTNGILSTFKQWRSFPSMNINRFWIHKNCTVIPGNWTRATPATWRGQSFSEHGYQAGAFINDNFTYFMQNID